MIQTAEGVLDETHSILQRMRELAVQGANDTNEDIDREAIQEQLNALIDEIDRIAETTKFNNQKLLGGADGTEVFNGEFHIGANAGQSIEVTIGDMTANGIGLEDLITNLNDLEADESLTQTQFDAAITTINTAINNVSTQRSELGAVQNRLEHTISNLDNASENLQAAESRIRDVDMAREMMEFTKNNILSQASQSMLAQANQQPQSVLQLLQ
ncbi:flagellin protein FlaA [Geomicrobium sp. JCM 19055]|nr:flagellin protein FlaA [Geomicrobium sp. JCM 19055]